MNLKVLSYNIRYGGIGRAENLAAVIERVSPDIVVFQEATEPRVIAQLAEQSAMSYWGAQAGFSLAFISRIAIARHEWHHPPAVRRAYLEIVPAEFELRIFGVHLSAIHSNWTERRRVRELNAILTDIRQNQQGFHIIVGDFNTLAPGELLDLNRLPLRLRAFTWLTGSKIRWRTIQIMLDANYLDGYRSLHPHDKGFTFPTWDAHLRLDFLFLPDKYAQHLKACEVINGATEAAQASDHYPLLAQLEI